MGAAAGARRPAMAATTGTSGTLWALCATCLLVRIYALPTLPAVAEPEPACESIETTANYDPNKMWPPPSDQGAGTAGVNIPIRASPPHGPHQCTEVLYVSVSPLRSRDIAPRLAEVNWDYAECKERPARAVIFKRDAEDWPASLAEVEQLEWSADITAARGKLVSNFSVPRTLPFNWDRDTNDSLKMPGEHCFDFKAALLNDRGEIINIRCLRIQPTWMEGFVAIGGHNLALVDMMIPGTHNSASFSRQKDDYDSHMVRYLLTQELTVWEQLVWGVRYLDMRVGYYPQDMGDQQNDSHPDHGQKFWVNHDMVRIQPLRPILEEIRHFLKIAQQEVIILDFHRFPVGFGTTDDSIEDSEPHQLLIDMIKEVFDDLLVPNDREHMLASLKELHRRDRRIIVSYGDRTWQTKEMQYFWQPIPQNWGNQQTLDGLVSYLDRALNLMYSKRIEFYALMAELTPTMFDVLLNMKGSSLRYMADQVNWNITASYRSGLWYRYANIIAVDYIESSDIVNVAIDSNRWRSQNRRDHNEASRFEVSVGKYIDRVSKPKRPTK